jgi:hypothetical protein
MTEDTAYTLLWILIFTTFGFIIGWACGEVLGRSRCAEEKVEALRHQLKHAALPTPDRQLKEMRSVLNDAHKHILAVSKGLQKPAR